MTFLFNQHKKPPEYSEASSSGISTVSYWECTVAWGVVSWGAAGHDTSWVAECALSEGPHPVHPGREVRMNDRRNPLATTNSLELFRNHQHYWNTERWDHDRNRHANVHPLLNVELTSEISVAASKPERIELELGPVILATNQTPQISCPEGVTSPPKCSVCEMIQCR